MAVPVLAVVLAIVVSVCGFPSDVVDDRNTKFINNIRSRGYPAEVHQVTTSDGYILNMHRIPHGRRGCPGKKPVVFLMHGLFSTSSHYIFLGPRRSIAYSLADAGFDVWMGNQRGNMFSRKHVSLNPDDRREKLEFFDFSWEEIGTIDIPAMVDYALATTGQEKLHYIGHSQGGTVFLVQASMNPEFGEKIASAHLLAGVGFMENFPFNPLRAVADRTTLIYALGVNLGIVEISFDALPKLPERPAILENGLVDYCVGDPEYKAFCQLIGVNEIMDVRNISLSDIPIIPDMGGAALKQIAHYGQNIKDATFRRFDYGPLLNRVRYGSINPPDYDLSKITINVTMHYTVSDILLDEKDVLAMAALIPNCRARKVERESFRHVSFIFAPDVKRLVTDYIIEELEAYEYPESE